MAYRGRVAHLYDLFYADKDYAAEASFVHELVQRHGIAPPGPALDLACGTGRHAERLRDLGYDVTGVDVSRDMVDRARSRVPTGRFLVQDVADLDADGPYQLVTFLFDSIGYLVSNQRIERGLGRLASHLTSTGVAVIEFWHAPPMLRGFDPVRARRWEHEGGEVLRISSTSLQPADQTATVDYTVVEIAADGRATVTEERHVNRYFQVQEIALLLTHAGLEPTTWHAGFTHRPVDADTWHVVVVAKRAEAVA